jgi:hypothetical protein
MRSFRSGTSPLVRVCTAATALAMLGTAPQPEPSASGAPTPLTEIGRVRTSVCATIVAHANGAIDDALADDTDVHDLIVGLETAQLDGATDFKRRTTYGEIERAAARLRETALAGEDEIRRMRADAADSPEPRKTELKAFADALGGALYRQRMMGIETQRLVAVQQGREAAGGLDPRTSSAAFGTSAQASSVDRTFRSVAADFIDRAKHIAVDEGVAADHSAGATAGC